MPDLTPEPTLTKTTYEFDIDGEVVVQWMPHAGGKRARTIIADRAEVTIYAHDGRGRYVTFEGPQRLKDGTLSARRTCFWTIGGRWPSKDSPPPITADLLAAVEALS